jgi:hypothetical protein
MKNPGASSGVWTTPSNHPAPASGADLFFQLCPVPG